MLLLCAATWGVAATAEKGLVCARCGIAGKVIGKLAVEVLQAGGWQRQGDLMSPEDVYVVVVVDGGVAQTPVKDDSRAPMWGTRRGASVLGKNAQVFVLARIREKQTRTVRGVHEHHRSSQSDTIRPREPPTHHGAGFTKFRRASRRLSDPAPDDVSNDSWVSEHTVDRHNLSEVCIWDERIESEHVLFA